VKLYMLIMVFRLLGYKIIEKHIYIIKKYNENKVEKLKYSVFYFILLFMILGKTNLNKIIDITSVKL